MKAERNSKHAHLEYESKQLNISRAHTCMAALPHRSVKAAPLILDPVAHTEVKLTNDTRHC